MPILKKDETNEVVTTWIIIEDDLEQSGLKFFSYLFLKHPEVRSQFFPKIVSDDDKTIGIHGTRVIEAIGSMVLYVQNEDDVKLVDKITQIARTHYHRGIASKTFYEVMTMALMEYLSHELGPAFTPTASAAWRKLFDTLVAIVSSEVDKLDGGNCVAGNPCVIS